MTKPSPFRYFKTSPAIIRLAVMMYIRFPLSLRNVEDLPHERGIDICPETVRCCWNRFGPLFAAGMRRKRIQVCVVHAMTGIDSTGSRARIPREDGHSFHGIVGRFDRQSICIGVRW